VTQALEAMVAAGIDDAQEMTLMSSGCASHSLVLGTMPVFDALGDLPSRLCQLGALLESGRIHLKYVSALRKRVNAKFKYCQVEEFPPEVVEFQRKARLILQRTRPAMDLTEEDEKCILQADNGDWSSPDIIHWCLHRRCPLGCNGNPSVAKDGVQMACELSIGGTCIKPLKFRWKGMDRANPWADRGRQQHDLLQHSLIRVWKTKELADADAQLVELGEDGVSDGVKTAVKANKVLKGLAADTNGIEHETACSPLTSNVKANSI